MYVSLTYPIKWAVARWGGIAEHESSGSLTDVSLLPLLLATADTVSAGLGSVFTEIKGAFCLSFSSIPTPAAPQPTPLPPNPSSLDWFPLTMTFLRMPSSPDGAVGSSWLSADFGVFAL